MASNDFYTSSPTVVLPPTHPNSYFADGHYATQNAHAFDSNGIVNASTTPHANGSIPPTPGSLAGRKRSRGDIYDPDEDEEASSASHMNPDGGLNAMETDLPTARPVQVAHAKRPSVSSRKSQRTDSGAALGPSADNHLAQLVLPPQMRDVTEEPLIDEATRVLGISWARMDATECSRISQAAYTKWIQKHYPALTDVSVWFENSAIPGYLVEARNALLQDRGYYLFSHDLTEARLVTTEPGQLVPRLQMLPALELAAPGGCLRAEVDPITAAQNEVDGVQMALSSSSSSTGAASGQTDEDSDEELLRGRIQDYAYPRGRSTERYETSILCGAHAMELD